MSHIVIPFNTRLVTKHAKHILQADRARARKFLAGLHPHGPNATHELRKRRHHPRHHHHGTTTTDPSTGSGTAPVDGDSIDVTNAGTKKNVSTSFCNFFCRRHLYDGSWGR